MDCLMHTSLQCWRCLGTLFLTLGQSFSSFRSVALSAHAGLGIMGVKYLLMMPKLRHATLD